MSIIPTDLRVVLIDDNEIDLFFHEKLIWYQGISNNVIPFNNVPASLDFFSRETASETIPPTVILLDIQLPETDGFDFLKSFETYPARLRSKCAILMVSSSLDFGDISRTNANIMVHHLLKKPLDAAEFKRTVEGLFSVEEK